MLAVLKSGAAYVPLDPAWPLARDPAWEVVCFHWLTAAGPQCAEGFVLAPGSTTQLAVISDIDDTIEIDGGWAMH